MPCDILCPSAPAERGGYNADAGRGSPYLPADPLAAYPLTRSRLRDFDKKTAGNTFILMRTTINSLMNRGNGSVLRRGRRGRASALFLRMRGAWPWSRGPLRLRSRSGWSRSVAMDHLRVWTSTGPATFWQPPTREFMQTNETL